MADALRTPPAPSRTQARLHGVSSSDAAPPAPVIEVRRLSKSYGGLVAVDELSFALAPGTALALVGPNGSGKTTTVECIQGLRRPDSGDARLLGLHPNADRDQVWRRVGVLFQETSYHNRIRLREAIWLHESFYERPLDGDELLEAFGLTEKRNTFFCRLSGGQKRRFLILLAVLGNPEVLILDEPTTGLDPQARNNVWEVLRGMRDRGTSVLVTTHQLDEAEQHCDIAAIMDRGELLCMDAPRALLAAHGMEIQADLPAGAVSDDDLRDLAGATQVQTTNGRTYAFGRGEAFRSAVTALAGDSGVAAADLATGRARLEDLFLLLTGRSYREE